MLSGRWLRSPKELYRAAALLQHISQQHLGPPQKPHWSSTKLQSTGHITFKRVCLGNPPSLPKTYPHKINVKDQNEKGKAPHLPLHRVMSRAWTTEDMFFAASNHRAATVCLFTGPTVRAEWNCYCFWSDISGDRLGNPPDGLSWRASSQGKPLPVEASASLLNLLGHSHFCNWFYSFFPCPPCWSEQK